MCCRGDVWVCGGVRNLPELACLRPAARYTAVILMECICIAGPDLVAHSGSQETEELYWVRPHVENSLTTPASTFVRWTIVKQQYMCK